MANDIEAAARAYMDAIEAKDRLADYYYGEEGGGYDEYTWKRNAENEAATKAVFDTENALRAALAAPASETDVEWLLRQMSKQDLRTLRDIAETFPRDRDAPKYALPAAPASGFVGQFQRSVAELDAAFAAAPASGAVEEALERCVEVMDEQTDAVSSGGEEWDAVLEQARAALRGKHPKGGHDTGNARGEE